METLARNPFLVLSALWLLLFGQSTSGSPFPEPEHSSSLLILDQLKSKIMSLEASIDEKTRQLRSKDERIRQLEKIIQEKSETITFLENQLQKVNNGQEIRFCDNGLVDQVGQHYILTHWKEGCTKVLKATLGKVLESKAQFEKWSQPHIEKIYTKVIPELKKLSLACITYLGECIPSVTTQTVELYHVGKETILHHVVNVQELAYPFIKEVRKMAQPFISQVSIMSRLCLDKVYVVMEPYTRRIIGAYEYYAKYASTYHHQVQQMLKENELTRPLATIELAWFAASAMLILPVIFMLKLYSEVFGSGKSRNHRHRSHSTGVRRGAKRRHPSHKHEM